MSGSLLILCLAAFAMVAALVSVLVGAALPVIDRLALLIAPRHRVRLWLGLAALPFAVAAVAVLASFLPAIGLGADHCLAHGPHHPHLCPHHVGGAPGLALVFVAAWFALRFVQLAVAFVRNLWRSDGASRLLAQASDTRDGVLVFPSDEPQAFVLGTLRPRVYVSRGLFALGQRVMEPVLAHERVHAKRRDLLWRALCPVLATGHLPSVTSAIRSRVSAAQEMAADVEAAEALHDGRIMIAEALVMLAKRSLPASPGLSFTHGDLTARVHGLLEDHRARSAWPARVLLLGGLVVPVAVGLSHGIVHHGLETLLGALS